MTFSQFQQTIMAHRYQPEPVTVQGVEVRATYWPTVDQTTGAFTTTSMLEFRAQGQEWTRLDHTQQAQLFASLTMSEVFVAWRLGALKAMAGWLNGGPWPGKEQAPGLSVVEDDEAEAESDGPAAATN